MKGHKPNKRPLCWLCGHRLMYVKGAPVWAIVIEDGVEHKVHKDCKERIGIFSDREDAKEIIQKAFCSTGCKI